MVVYLILEKFDHEIKKETFKLMPEFILYCFTLSIKKYLDIIM